MGELLEATAMMARAIETYIRAKDQNRPHLMTEAFASDATVRMIIDTTTISFPPTMSGLDAITDTLVRTFGQNYENIYTFCLSAPPEHAVQRFSCRWLVAMSDKQSGTVRVGTGLYDWHCPDRIEELVITISTMVLLDPAALHAVMNWVSGLPYPWCPAEAAWHAMPTIEGLEDVRRSAAR
jgi:hypothetical protein